MREHRIFFGASMALVAALALGAVHREALVLSPRPISTVEVKRRDRRWGKGPRPRTARSRTAFDNHRIERAEAKRARRADRLRRIVAAGGMIAA